MLKIAKASSPEGNFIWMDMRDLAFQDNYFDGIWAMASFLNIKKIDAQRVLISFKRVLNKGEVLAMAVKKGAGEIHENEDGETRLFSLYGEAELEDSLEKAGFRVIEHFTEEAKPNIWISVVSRVSK